MCPRTNVLLIDHTGTVASTTEVMFLSVFFCLFASRIIQELLHQFSQNSVERWHIGHGINH